MKITFAIAVLLANTSAVKLQQKAAFPHLPVSGQDLARVAAQHINDGKEVLSHEMYHQNCQSDYMTLAPGQDDDCWENGLRRDLSRFNEDVTEGLKQFDIDFSQNTYNAKFITDLIEAEYAAFAADFTAHREEIGQEIDGALGQAYETLNGLGLAQVKEQQNCRDVRDQFWQAINEAEEEQRRLDQENAMKGIATAWTPTDWEARDREYNTVMTECYMQSQLAQTVARNLDLDEMTHKFNMVVRMAVAGAGDQKNVDELANAIEELNQTLTHEAERVGMEAPTLPNPQDTASKIAQAVIKAGPLLDGEEAQRELRRGLEDMRNDAIKEAYRFERDVNEVQNGAFDRDEKEVAEALSGLGLPVTAESLGAFVDGVAASAEKLMNDDNVKRNIAQLSRDLTQPHPPPLH